MRALQILFGVKIFSSHTYYPVSYCILRCLNKLHSVLLIHLWHLYLSHLLVQLSLSTGVSFSEAKLMGLASSQGTGPIPRDMSYPVPKGGSWHDLYDYIRYGNLTRQQNVHHWNCVAKSTLNYFVFVISGAILFGSVLLFLSPVG